MYEIGVECDAAHNAVHEPLVRSSSLTARRRAPSSSPVVPAAMQQLSVTYAALRAVLLEHDAPATALAGLPALAGLLGGRHRLSPGAASRWMTGPNARLEDQRPLDVWLYQGAGRVIDAANAESTQFRDIPLVDVSRARLAS